MQAIDVVRRYLRDRIDAITLVLAAVFCAGVSYIALLPVWEGFDEFAHYSSVQQIGDTGTIPLYGKAHIAGDVERYTGPWPYTSGAGPDFNPPGHSSYRAFSQSGAALFTGPVERQFAPTGGMNWQAQHPPLFYALVAPVYLSTKTWDWVDHLFALRLTAWTLAFAGIAIGAKASAKLTGDERAGLIIAGYPLLVPQFIPEMARLGNDSLCLLLLAIAWVISLQMLKGEGGPRRALALGGVLGLGLMTKAFFLPVSAGVAALMALHWINTRKPAILRDIVIVGAGAAVIGLWWYVRNYLTLGSFSGANDFIRTAEGFNMARGLLENFSLNRLVHGLAEIVITFTAIGGWSLIIPPVAILVVSVLLPGVTLAGWVIKLPKREDLVAWAPVFFVAPILGGLFWHMLHNLALPVRFAGTPGWYLHIAAVPIAFAMARGWRWPRVCAALAASAYAAGIALELLQLSLFSGCSTKLGDNKGYNFEGASCFIDWRALDAIATPWLGLTAGALSIVLVALAVWKAGAFTRPPTPSASPSDALRSGS